MPTEIENTMTKHTYGGGSANEWCSLTTGNICMNEVRLRRRHPTLTLKPHLRWEAFLRLKRTHSGDTLHRVKYIYGGDLHNSTDRLRLPRWLRRPLRAQLLWAISPPTISMIFDCNYIHGNGCYTWLLLPTHQIRSVLPAAPMAPGKTTFWVETITSQSTTLMRLIGGSNQSMRYE
jgi:hypothetical protein